MENGHDPPAISSHPLRAGMNHHRPSHTPSVVVQILTLRLPTPHYLIVQYCGRLFLLEDQGKIIINEAWSGFDPKYSVRDSVTEELTPVQLVQSVEDMQDLWPQV